MKERWGNRALTFLMVMNIWHTCTQWRGGRRGGRGETDY